MDPKTLRTELVAGLSVAMILVPQAIAYAQLAGLPPQAGLYAACLPVLVAALFGVARPLQNGPTALVSLLTAAALGPLVAAGSDQWVTYALALAFLVGVFQVGFGFLRLGQLVNFLANPVVAGFTSAAAIIIATSQLGAVFGIEQPRAGWHFLGVFAVIKELVGGFHWPTVALATLTGVMIFAIRRWKPRWPAYLLALATATVMSRASRYGEWGGAVIGDLPTGFPGFAFPTLSFGIVADLLLVALTIALLSFVETATVTRMLAARSRQALNLDREIIGQGLANLTASVVGGYPISGSLARSHVAWEAGARTGIAEIVAALLAGVVILFAAPVFTHMPIASLGVVIIMAIGALVSFQPLRSAFRANRQDGVVGVTTFALTLAVAPALHQAVLVGVVLSLGLFLYRSMRPRAAVLGRHPDGSLRDAELYDLPPCEHITVLRFDGPLYFANARHFADRVLAALSAKPELRYLIVDCSGIAEIDATGEQILAEMLQRLNEGGTELVLCSVRSPVRDVIARTGLLERISRERVHRDADAALEWAWSHLEPGHRDRCPLRLYPTT